MGMTLNEVFAALVPITSGYATDNGGVHFVAKDPAHPYVLLTSGKYVGFAIILAFVSDRPEGGDIPAANPMSDMEVSVFVGYSQDLRADMAAWIYDSATMGKKSLLEVVSDLKDLMGRTAIEWDDDGNTERSILKYKGTQPVTTEIGPLRAYEMTFSMVVRD